MRKPDLSKLAFMKETPPQVRRLFVILPVAVVALAAIFIILGFFRRAPQMAMPPQGVILAEATLKEMAGASEFVAQTEADSSVDLLARVSGFLVAKGFKDGDVVRKNQVLFQIEPDQYQSQVESAEAKLLSAQAQLDRASLDFRRITDLYNKKTSPKSDYDSAKASFEVATGEVMSAQAALTQARLNLDYASIKAPFAGRVSDTPFSEGALLGPESGVLATLVSLDPIQVSFGVSDKAMASIRTIHGYDKAEGMGDWQVRLRLSNGQVYDRIGRLTYVAPLVDPKTDTVKMKATFPNPDHVLYPNQIVTAIVERARPIKRVTVPQEAVLTDDEGNFVLMPKAVDGENGPTYVAEARRVTTDGEAGADYVIKEGLAAGDKVIVKGLMSGGAALADGAAIRVIEPQAQGGGE